MKHLRSIVLSALCAALSCWTGAAWAQAPAQPQSQMEPLLRAAIESAPGMELTVTKATVPPGYKANSHSHPGETFVYIVSGRVLNQVGDEEPKTYEAGDFFFETANATHARFENLSADEPVVFIIYGIRPEGAR
jgi:quercetin dioxygenase-like cupin family protein